MAGIKKVIEQMDKVAKQAAAAVVNRAPSPEGCGCGRRKRHMVDQLRKGVGLGAIVEDLVDDLRGKPVEEREEQDNVQG